MKVCVIPARGGSKRIPRKNAKLFLGIPIIERVIDAVRASGLFDRVVVSTDDSEIAALARKAGAETPFVRPAALSDDHTTTAAVLKHALNFLDREGVAPTVLCGVYPTAVFVDSALLGKAQALAQTRKARCVFPLLAFESPVQRAIALDPAGKASFVYAEHELTRTNDLPKTYHDAGQFYWLDAAAFRAEARILGPGAFGLVLPKYGAVDLDEPEDWVIAEMVYRSAKAADRATNPDNP